MQGFFGLRHRLLFLSGVSFCLGLLGAWQGPLGNGPPALFSGLASLLGLLGALRSERALPAIGLGFLSLGIGVKQEILARQPPPALRAALGAARPLVRLRGKVVERVPRRRGETEGRYLLAVESVEGRGSRASARGLLRLRVVPDDHALGLGDRIEALGRLRGLHPPSNQHEPDRRAAAFERGIFGSLEAARVSLRRLEASPSWPDAFGRLVAQVRQSLLGRLEERLRPDAGEIAVPLLLGLWPLRFSEELGLFYRTGTVHLLAVSGLHVVLLFGGLFLFLSRRTRRRRILLLPFGGILLFYSLLTGSQPPVLRASLMLLAFAAGLASRRRPDALNVIGATALAVAWLQPEDVDGPSFQLSFAAVLGIALFARPIRRRMGALGRRGSPFPPPLSRLGWAAAISAAAFLATAPLVSLHFGAIPLASIPATLMLAPLLPPALLLATATATLPVALAGAPAYLLEGLLGAATFALRQFDSIPGILLPTAGVSLLAVLLLTAGLLGGVATASRRISTAAVGLGLLGFFLPARRDGLALHVLDVGHGNALVVELPDGETLLFDAGSAERPGLARTVLLPFLQGRGISHLDEVFVSHEDADHTNALPELASRVRLRRIHSGEPAPPVLRAAGHGAEISFVEGRVRLPRGAVELELLRPRLDPGANENDASLSLRIGYAGKVLLLCGDLEDEGISALLEHETIEADVLLLPHHGLPAEGLDDLLASVGPRWLLVSSGRRFGREGEGPLFAGSRTLSTLREGQISVRIRPSGKIEVWTFARGSVTLEAPPAYDGGRKP